MSPAQTVLVTGCSSGGIGAAIALHVAGLGHHVFVTARTTSKIPDSLSKLSNVSVLELDVSSAASISAAAQQVAVQTKALGSEGLDALVNNAGLGYSLPLLDANIDKAKNLFEINFWGVLRMVQAFSDLLILKRGRIVNISSVGTIANTPWFGIYDASKAAVNSLSETLQTELSPFGVRVILVMTGTVKTKFHANEQRVVLPPTSRYHPIIDTINGWVKGDLVPKGCSAEDLARQLADDITGKSSRSYAWVGANSTTIRFLSCFAPSWLMASVRSYGQGIAELTAAVKSKGGE